MMASIGFTWTDSRKALGIWINGAKKSEIIFTHNTLVKQGFLQLFGSVLKINVDAYTAGMYIQGVRGKLTKEQKNKIMKYTQSQNKIEAATSITVEGLRALLFNVGDQSANVSTISEEKYGEIITTKSVRGLRFELDSNGKQHIIIVTA